ncbi:hypothetical protein K449DRAFT_467406, partial [Hypoxylon sp. EC38]
MQTFFIRSGISGNWFANYVASTTLWPIAIAWADETIVCMRRHSGQSDPLEGRRIWFYPWFHLALSILAVALWVFAVGEFDETNTLAALVIVWAVLSFLDGGISLGLRLAFPKGDVYETMAFGGSGRTMTEFEDETGEDISLISSWNDIHTRFWGEYRMLRAIDTGAGQSSVESSSSRQFAAADVVEAEVPCDTLEGEPLLSNDIASDPGSPAVLHPSILALHTTSNGMHWSKTLIKWYIFALMVISLAELITVAFVVRSWLLTGPKLYPKSRMISTAIFRLSPPLLNMLVWIPLVLLSVWSRRLSFSLFSVRLSYRNTLTVCGLLLFLLRVVLMSTSPTQLYRNILCLS